MCVLLRVLEEVPAKRRTKKKLERRGFLFRNHGNQTRSLHKLFSFFDLVNAGVCINVPTFPYQRCSRPSSHVALLFISSLSFDWLLLQGEHQQRPLLRHAGHQEETHRQQEVKRDNLLNPPAPPSFSPSVHEHIHTHYEDCQPQKRLRPRMQVICTCWGDTTLLRGQQSSRKLMEICGLLHGAAHKQPVSPPSHIHPLPPPSHGHHMSFFRSP